MGKRQSVGASLARQTQEFGELGMVELAKKEKVFAVFSLQDRNSVTTAPVKPFSKALNEQVVPFSLLMSEREREREGR